MYVSTTALTVDWCTVVINLAIGIDLIKDLSQHTCTMDFYTVLQQLYV
jgi:hypothetical protein